MSGNRRRSRGTRRAISGAPSPAAARKASGFGACARALSRISTKGAKGGAPSASRQRPTNTSARRFRASSPSSSVRRVLPIPGSPATITNAPGARDRCVQGGTQLGQLGGPSRQRRASRPDRQGRRPVLLPDEFEEPPAVGNPLQAEAPRIPKLEIGNQTHEPADQFGHKDLAALGLACHAGGRVDRLPEDVAAVVHDLAGVDPDADADPAGRAPSSVSSSSQLQGEGEGESPAGGDEGRQKAVAERLHLPAGMFAK